MQRAVPLVLVVAFLVVPFAELALLLQVGEQIGVVPTVVVLVVVSLLGGWLVRREGARAWRRFREALASGRVPAHEVVDGALVVFGGALLLTPGFLTDFLGLFLVFPPTRALANRAIRTRAARSMGLGPLLGLRRRPAGGTRAGRAPDVVEAEVLDVTREGPQH